MTAVTADGRRQTFANSHASEMFKDGGFTLDIYIKAASRVKLSVFTLKGRRMKNTETAEHLFTASFQLLMRDAGQVCDMCPP